MSDVHDFTKHYLNPGQERGDNGTVVYEEVLETVMCI